MSQKPLSAVALRIKEVERQNQANKSTKQSYVVIGNGDSSSAKTEFAKRRAAILKSFDTTPDSSAVHVVIKPTEHSGDFSKKKNDMAKFFENQSLGNCSGSARNTTTTASIISAVDKDDPNYDKFSKYTTMQKFQIKESDIRQKMISDSLLTNDEIESFFVSHPSSSSASPMSSLEISVNNSNSADKMLKFEKMRKMGTPEPAIRQKMMTEGINKNEIEDFFALSNATTSITLTQKNSPGSSRQMSKMIMARASQSQNNNSNSSRPSSPFFNNDSINDNTSSSSSDIIDETGLFEKYIKMKKMRLPDGPIRQKMLTDGLKNKEITLFFDAINNGKNIIQFPSTASTTTLPSNRSSLLVAAAVADLNKKGTGGEVKELDGKPEKRSSLPPINTAGPVTTTTDTTTAFTVSPIPSPIRSSIGKANTNSVKSKLIITTSTTLSSNSAASTTSADPATSGTGINVSRRRGSVTKPSTISTSTFNKASSPVTPPTITITTTAPQQLPPPKPVKPVVITTTSTKTITNVIPIPSPRPITANVKPPHKPADYSAIPTSTATTKQSLWEAPAPSATDQPPLMLWEQLRDLRLARVAKMNAAKAVPLWEIPPLVIYPTTTTTTSSNNTAAVPTVVPTVISTTTAPVATGGSGVVSQQQESDEDEETDDEEEEDNDDDHEVETNIATSQNKVTATAEQEVKSSIKTSVLITAKTLNAKVKQQLSSTATTANINNSKSKKQQHKLAKKKVRQEPYSENYLQFRTLQAEMAHLLQDVVGESPLSSITSNEVAEVDTTTKETLIENPHFATYKKMRKMNMPELAIRQKMIFDGIPVTVVEDFMKTPLKLIVTTAPSPLMQRTPDMSASDTAESTTGVRNADARRHTEEEDYRDRISIRPFSFQAIFGELAGAFAVIEDEDDELYRASILKESLLQTSPPALRRIHLSNLGKAYVKNNSLRKRATFSIDPKTGLMIPSVVERISNEKSNYYLTHNNNGNGNGNNNGLPRDSMAHDLRSTKYSTITNHTTASRLHSLSTSSFVNENPIHFDKEDCETDTDSTLNSPRLSPQIGSGNNKKRVSSRGQLIAVEDLSVAPSKDSGCSIS